MKVLSVFGTRPEAIKMAPVVMALEADPTIESVVCVTGQHREMLEQVLNLFHIRPDHDLQIMTRDQSLNGLVAKAISAVDTVLADVRPDRVLVHGDTSTAMAAALAAFHRHIPIAHVEAGLRTFDLSQPWPEEMNRCVIDLVADLLFAPTHTAKENLKRSQAAGRIFVTGNTVIDGLEATLAAIEADPALLSRLTEQFAFLDPLRKIILVTGHRRESFGSGFENICRALTTLAARDDVQIVYPVHLNPNVQGPVRAMLGTQGAIHLLPPLDYLPFVYLMQRAHVILTDSGGVQEEAPSLGKPVLVMRDVTERPEAVTAGTVRLVGTDPDRIVTEISRLCDSEAAYMEMSRITNPYGDGHAAERIVAALKGNMIEEFN
ncbi:UDP-N-acetylglucosamine 2-epimerase (non-hydrolyzing) [Amorphus suaedae]